MCWPEILLTGWNPPNSILSVPSENLFHLDRWNRNLSGYRFAMFCVNSSIAGPAMTWYLISRLFWKKLSQLWAITSLSMLMSAKGLRECWLIFNDNDSVYDDLLNSACGAWMWWCSFNVHWKIQNEGREGTQFLVFTGDTVDWRTTSLRCCRSHSLLHTEETNTNDFTFCRLSDFCCWNHVLTRLSERMDADFELRLMWSVSDNVDFRYSNALNDIGKFVRTTESNSILLP